MRRHLRKILVVFGLSVMGMPPGHGAIPGEGEFRRTGIRPPPVDPQNPYVIRERMKKKLYDMSDRSDAVGLTYLTLRWAKESDAEYRKVLAQVLARYHHEDALPAITLAYDHEKDPMVQVGILEGLGWGRVERGLPLLFRVAESLEPWALRQAAIKSLHNFVADGSMDDPVMLRIGLILSKALQDQGSEYPETRQTIDALKKIKDVQLGRHLLEMFRRRKVPALKSLRAPIATVLVNFAPDPTFAHELLVELKREEDPEVRGVLMEGLIKADDPEAYVLVVDQLRTSREPQDGWIELLCDRVRNGQTKNFPEDLAGAIGRVMRDQLLHPLFGREHVFDILEVLPPPSVILVLREILERPASPNETHKAIALLAKWRAPEAVGVLIKKFSSDGDRTVRQAIMDVLTSWPGEEVNAFIKKEADSPDPVKQELARKALDIRGLSRPDGFTPRHDR